MLQALKTLSERLKTARENVFQIPESARQIDSAWYAGMAIRPADFSQQLSSLQVSLKRESDTLERTRAVHPLS
ncbi:MAG TPA: hypothetical protein VKB79_19340 [Bryobacteraceae bacterium]|nr:hypothetical protein [Bryobacteraceae bacterium]